MEKKVYLILSLLCGLVRAASAQAPVIDTTKRYTRVPSGYLIVLRQGDDVFAQLEKIAITEKIPSAHLSGLGFLNARLGFFNSKTKEYKPKDFADIEMGSFTGTIAWQDGKPSLHIHGVGADKSFKAYGGHLLGATVSTGSLEILVSVFDRPLQRRKDEPLGANVLQVGN